MIRNLVINNIAVIDKAEVELHSGFNVLTGETGAGKSIIIDSLNMLKGERISKELIRTGETKAKVSAIIDVTPLAKSFIEETLDIELDNEEIMISRELNTDGKNNIRINGMPVTLGVLKQVGEKLINIHGQHDNTSLLAKKTHISFINEYGKDKISSLLESYKKIYSEYNSIKSELDKLECDTQQTERRIEMLKFQVDEIESAQLKLGEDDELETRQDFLNNVQSISDAAQNAYMKIFDGTDYEPSAHDALWDGINELESVEQYDEDIKSIRESLSDAGYLISDKMRELKNICDHISYDEEEMNDIQERLDLIFNLKIKYVNTIEQILKYYDNISNELENIINSDENIEKLKAQLEKKATERQKTANELTRVRKETAKTLSDNIMLELKELEMSKVKFTVNIESCDFNSNGADDVEFMICTNVGEEFKPLAKIASGGELSRIMLAMKSVLSSCDAADTLIFDEIDTGVSGRAAQAIGEKLVKMSCGIQVLCITHLPQIASLADSHYLIQKHIEGDRTYTTVDLLDRQSHINEIARTLGGTKITDITLKNAEELVNQAQEIKKRQ